MLGWAGVGALLNEFGGGLAGGGVVELVLDGLEKAAVSFSETW